jgi:phospholipid/cholesterol/gamma-HCH transport system substrate-binding protein
VKTRSAFIGFSAFLVAAIVVTTLVYGTLRRDTTGPTDTYSAVFSDVTGLQEGDDVRIAGVRVGRVDAIALQDNQALVEFRMERDQLLYSNTIASVTYQNIVGQRYVGLSRRETDDGDRRLPAGSRIPLERTEPSFDVGALVNGFEPLFTLLDTERANKLSDALIEAFQGDSGSVTRLVVQTAELTQAFVGDDAVFEGLIDNLNTLVASLARQDANLDAVIGEARQVVGDLADRRDTLVSSLGSLNAVAGRLTEIGDASYPQLSEMLHRKPGVAQHITDIEDQMAFLGTNLPVLMKGLARLSQDGAYGNGYVCTLNVLGFFPGLNNLVPTIVRYASPGQVVKNTQKCRPAS